MKVGFAGAGNMAAAMARGWAATDERPERMAFVDAGSGRARALAGQVGGVAVDSLAELARESDAVVLAVKPAALDRVAEGLAEARAIVSVLGATPLGRLRAAFPDRPVVRAMPTVLVEIHRAVICHAPLGPAERELGPGILALLGALGRLVEVPDERMDAATAVMGCSPAYVALFAEAIAEAGGEAGLDPALAMDLVLDTLAGTAELLRERSPGDVRAAVASPGGSTEAGLEALERHDVVGGIGAAVEASLERMRA